MLKNYFLTAFRNLKRRKAYTLVNIVGLTLGISAAILIFSLVKYHLSFDDFHSQKDRIYRVVTEEKTGKTGYGAGVPPPLGKAFREDYSFAEKVARIATFGDLPVAVPFSGDGLKFQEEHGVSFTEREFFSIFDFPLLRGDQQTILSEPNTAIVTERIAKKYFGDADPIGQVIRLTNRFDNTRLDFRITGILRDLPVNTDRKQEIYVSYHNLDAFHGSFDDTNWYQTSSILQCYVLLKPGVALGTVDNMLPAFSEKYYNRSRAGFHFSFQPLRDIHFNTAIDGKVDKQNLLALAFIGLFLIITACMNFVNLATAQALGRSKEIGVRKVLGGRRAQLFWQFMAETAVIATAALVLGLILAQLALPAVNHYFGLQLHIDLLHDVRLLAFLAVLLLVVIFLSGSYPGLVLAGFQPVVALRGKLTQKHIGGFSLRKGLVVAQFAISQLLIIGTLVIAHQMRFAKQADMGFHKEAVVMLQVPVRESATISTLRGRLAQVSGVEDVSFFAEEPAGNETYSARIIYGGRSNPENFDIYYKAGDDRYVPTFGLQLIAGRNMFPSDTGREFLLNETAVKKLDVPSPEKVIGQPVRINGRKGTVVGVVKDFHNKSFHDAINPLCIITGINWYGRCAVRIHAGSLKPALAAIEEAWNASFPDHVYKYDFLDERIGRFYKEDRMLLNLVQVFAFIAIVIGCLGLYGLVSFMAAQKNKEVGIRKVLGASVRSILWLFGREFTWLLLIAFVLAAPLAWWVMNNWLQNFAYRVEIGAGIFGLAILVTFVVAVMSVGYRSVKTALMDPVRSLRTE